MTYRSEESIMCGAIGNVTASGAARTPTIRFFARSPVRSFTTYADDSREDKVLMADLITSLPEAAVFAATPLFSFRQSSMSMCREAFPLAKRRPSHPRRGDTRQ
jgi:hypothetical protein